MEIEIQVSQKVASIYQELLSPLANLSGSCAILKGKIPLEVAEPIDIIEGSTAALIQDIRKPFQDIKREYDFTSPTKTALQIHQSASQWKKHIPVLSKALRQIQEIKTAGSKLSDPSLDALLSENLPNGYKQLLKFLDYLESMEENDLLGQ